MTEGNTALPNWPDFERDYVATGIPHRFVVRAVPEVSIFVDQDADRIGARFATSGSRGDAPVQMLSEIHVEDVVSNGLRAVEIWTGTEPRFARFYQLVREIVGAVVDDGADPDSALAAAVSQWEALLSRPSLMSEEVQAGLFGELWLLGRLVRAFGPTAVDAWVGPVRQPHDFRLGDIELEVKTTSGSGRVHTINGVGQLQPSLDCVLYLLSLKLANAGTGGHSLPEAVQAIEAALKGSDGALKRFHIALDAVGYATTDAHRYTRRRRLRDSAMLIHVADGAPRLTEEALAAVDRRFCPERIGRIEYSIDVEGLGVPDGSDAFHAILPPPKMPEPPHV